MTWQLRSQSCTWNPAVKWLNLAPFFWPRSLLMFLAFYPLTGGDARCWLRRLRAAFQIPKCISLLHRAIHLPRLLRWLLPRWSLQSWDKVCGPALRGDRYLCHPDPMLWRIAACWGGWMPGICEAVLSNQTWKWLLFPGPAEKLVTEKKQRCIVLLPGIFLVGWKSIESVWGKVSCRSMANDISRHLQSRHLLAFNLARLIAKYQYLHKAVRKKLWIFERSYWQLVLLFRGLFLSLFERWVSV